MNQPSHIANFTAANPGMMTLQGTNQYIVGKDSAVVIDVALSSDGNMDGIIEQAEAMVGRGRGGAGNNCRGQCCADEYLVTHFVTSIFW